MLRTSSHVSVHGTASTLVLRPSRFWRGMYLGAVALVAASVSLGVALGEEWAVIFVLPGLVGGGIALYTVHLWTVRLVVSGHEIAVLGWFVRRRQPRRLARHVVRAHVIAGRWPLRDTGYVVDTYGRAMLKVTSHQYSRRDIDRLIWWLRLPVSGPPQPVTSDQLARMYPGMVSWAEAHYWALNVGIAAVAVLMMAGLGLWVGLGLS